LKALRACHISFPRAFCRLRFVAQASCRYNEGLVKMDRSELHTGTWRLCRSAAEICRCRTGCAGTHSSCAMLESAKVDLQDDDCSKAEIGERSALKRPVARRAPVGRTVSIPTRRAMAPATPISRNGEDSWRVRRFLRCLIDRIPTKLCGPMEAPGSLTATTRGRTFRRGFGGWRAEVVGC
jgi:hypothetical protein